MKKLVYLFLFFITILLLLNSCASNCTKTHKYWNRHKCVEYFNPNIIKNERYEYS